MLLQQIFSSLPEARIFGESARDIPGLEYHSQRVSAGQLFFAIRGFRQDGNRFIAEALERGAAAVVSEQAPETFRGPGPLAWVQVPNAREALAVASAEFYGHPSRELQLVGITGTNGKTTVAWVTASILEACGWKPALFGTIEYRLGCGEHLRRSPAAHTTPESLDLQRMLRTVASGGGRAAVMEVSSHSLVLDRVTGCRFHTAVFTNFSRDHLDFHGDVESYYAAKEKLLAPSRHSPPPDFAVLNADDPRCAALRATTASRVLRYAIEAEADVTPRKWKTSREGLEFTANTPAGPVELRSPLVGRHNVYNLLAAVAAALTLEVPLDEISHGIFQARVPGRMEAVDQGQPFAVLVDYAHTEEALRNLVASAREMTPRGRLLLVFGCGGDRDRGKRPLMGIVAGGCDWVALTSDNPRYEDPLQIINDVTVGLQKARANYVVEPDRARAIAKALQEARAGDTVLIAGKGHETHQTVGEQKIPFDDREVARAALREMGFDAP